MNLFLLMRTAIHVHYTHKDECNCLTFKNHRLLILCKQFCCRCTRFCQRIVCVLVRKKKHSKNIDRLDSIDCLCVFRWHYWRHSCHLRRRKWQYNSVMTQKYNSTTCSFPRFHGDCTLLHDHNGDRCRLPQLKHVCISPHLGKTYCNFVSILLLFFSLLFIFILLSLKYSRSLLRNFGYVSFCGDVSRKWYLRLQKWIPWGCPS